MEKPGAPDGRLAGFEPVSRRRLLKWGLGAGGAILMGGGVGLWRLRGTAPHVAGLRSLTDHEYRTMAALASTILPRGGAFALGADDFDLARTFDGFLADEPAENIRDLKRALFLVEYGPVVFERRLVTFSNLDPDARHRHWDLWEQGTSALRRQAATAFRKFLMLVFYDHPEVWPAVGYGGGPAEGSVP